MTISVTAQFNLFNLPYQPLQFSFRTESFLQQMQKKKRGGASKNQGPARKGALAAALAKINSVAPWSLTIADVIRLTNENKKSSKLALLELASLVEKASFGRSLAELNDFLDGQASDVATPLDHKLPISDFGRAVADRVSMGYDEGLHKSFLLLQEAVEDPCERGDKIASADEKTKLVTPFLKRQPHQVSVDEVCHIIEFLADHGITDCSKAKKLDKYHECEDWFDSWLALHPNVAKYLDPVVVYVSPVGAAAPAGWTASLAMLPIGPQAVTVAPTRLAVPGLAAGSAHLYRVDNAVDAKSVSIAMRTHFANPAGGPGGAGAPLVIGRFSTAGFGGITFI